jgi:hypothetical protein
MSSTAAHMAREFSGFNREDGLAASAWNAAGRFTSGEHEAADDLLPRALGSAGMAALAALPFLLLSSFVLNASLAVPAAIGLGYIAVSHSLASHRHRRAAVYNAAVLFGLLSWLVFFLIDDRPLSGGSLAASLLAPLFAAAPGLARALLQKRNSRKSSAPGVRSLAIEKVASLDELAPTELTLLVDCHGGVLAATAAARRLLGLLPDAFEHSLAGLVSSGDLPKLLDGIGRCRLGGPALELSLEAIEEGGVLEATLSACGENMVAMKLRRPQLPEPSAKGTDLPPCSVVDAKRDAGAESDIGEAVALMSAHWLLKARARGITLNSRAEAGLAASCDQHIARRLASLLVEASLNASQSGGDVSIVARRLRGVVLLRATCSPQSDATGASPFTPSSPSVTKLRELAEAADGTLMLEEQNTKAVLSLRLPQAWRELGRTKGCSR